MVAQIIRKIRGDNRLMFVQTNCYAMRATTKDCPYELYILEDAVYSINIYVL